MRFTALFCALLALPLLSQASHAADFELTIVHANDTHSAAAGIDGRYAACREDDACTGGRVTVNGRTAKPSVQLKVGDVVEIAFGGGAMKFRVAEIAETSRKEQAEKMYEIID